jgi:carbon monoxide dehydrogenase subunit G
MEFRNEFTVEAPIDEVYEAMLDPEQVAPAMPGAQVLEKVSDDVYKVAIKIKLGPVTMTYRGTVEIVDKDPDAHAATMSVKAKEARGQGTATAQVNMNLEEGGGATQATMVANVQLSGKAAAMGRGIIEDVSSRLVDTFAGNLAEMLGSGGSEAASGEGDAAPTPGEAQGSGSAASGHPRAAVAEAVPGSRGKEEAAARKPPSRPKAAPAGDEGLDALSLGAGMVADRVKDPKVLGGVLGGVLVVGYLLGRRSRG